MNFSETITRWYGVHHRPLPWRNTRNPYLIWLSEVILQQTRVDQGLAYFHKFTEQYPDVQSLAAAEEEAVLKLWQGLGYYSRARNLHFTARVIANELNGRFPDQYEDILKLKGIGKYTAAAISSFAFRLPYPVVDGNVYRLLSRYFGIDTPIDSNAGVKQFQELAEEVLDRDRPDLHNQAMMEMGALVCTPKNAQCHDCPLRAGCYALNNKQVALLPVKSKKMKQRKRYFDYLVINDGAEVYLNKRTEKDIWHNLYDFPMIENDHPISRSGLTETAAWKSALNNTPHTVRSVSNWINHKLTHQDLHARFWEIDIVSQQWQKHDRFVRAERDELGEFPFPKLIENYIFAD